MFREECMKDYTRQKCHMQHSMKKLSELLKMGNKLKRGCTKGFNWTRSWYWYDKNTETQKVLKKRIYEILHEKETSNSLLRSL